MDKYNKHRFFTALVLEIRALLYSTPSDAIFTSKFPFSCLNYLPAPEEIIDNKKMHMCITKET